MPMHLYSTFTNRTFILQKQNKSDKQMKYLIIADAIDTLDRSHDSSIGMMQAIQQRDGEIWVCEPRHLYRMQSAVHAQAMRISINHNEGSWYRPLEKNTISLTAFDIILMRKDPPYNMPYIYTTHLLQHAIAENVLVSNHPQALRDINEKSVLGLFTDLTTDFLISAELNRLQHYIDSNKDCVIKALDSMGGQSVQRLRANQDNTAAILALTQTETTPVMVMPYIDAITNGDTRVIIINGKVCRYGYKRTPPTGNLLANIAAGGIGTVVELNARQREISAKVAEFCLQQNIHLAGIDVIGDYLTEINITSPTCLREIEQETGETLCQDYIAGLEAIR